VTSNFHTVHIRKGMNSENTAILGPGWGLGKFLTFFENPVEVVIMKGSIRRFFRKLSTLLDDGLIGIGYFGYELSQDFLPVRFRANKLKIGIPPSAFMFFDGGAKISKMFVGKDGETKIEPTIEKREFLRMVERIKEYIAEGDVYEVNISQRFDFVSSCKPLEIFSNLIRAQPAPFTCFLDFSDFQIISGSMELFLKRNGKRIMTRPIKGTRPRHPNVRIDREMVKDLRESEKERAENLMIVDLMRNDLSKVCEFGSVRVTKLFEVEGFSTLYQMFSEVIGRLRNGMSLQDILVATFPPGSVTGAPKVRAMEIIEELEPHRREPYCGATAVVMPTGDFTMSVAIRTMAMRNGYGAFWVGGGITWDSDPEAEYDETVVKAVATCKALGLEKLEV